jgi:hypothetical protein
MRPGAVLGAAFGLVLLSAAVPGDETPGAKAAIQVNRAAELLLVEQSTEAQLRQGFLSLLDALLLVAPEIRPPGSWPEKVAEARRLIHGGSLVEPRAVALLGECYRETHGGAAFRMPPTVHTIADARDHIRLRLVAAPDLIKTGATDEAARRLLEAAVAIVTPMHR